MKKQFTETPINDRREMTKELAIRFVLGDTETVYFDHKSYPDDFYSGANSIAVETLKNNISLNGINAIVYAAHQESFFIFGSSDYYEALAEMDAEGLAILSYFLFFYDNDRDGICDRENFRVIPILEEIIEFVFIDFEERPSHFAENLEKVKSGKSLNPQGFSGDVGISKDVLTAIILLGNFSMNEKMFEAGIWSIQRQGLREIVCTIFAFNQEIFPEHLQITAKRILQELNPEFVEYVEFVEKRLIQRRENRKLMGYFN